MISSNFCCWLSTMPPGSGTAKTMSDQRVSIRRSSIGKSNSVASSSVVSSMETVSTQSNVSPSGSESSTFAVRSRIIGSRLRRLLGAETPRTVLRCSVCFGGSIAMNVRIRSNSSSFAGPGRSPNEMPPAEENVSQLPSVARTSSYFMRDQ